MIVHEVLLAAFLTLLVVYHGTIGALVYRKEAPRSRARALFWALVVFLVPMFGLIAYKMGDYVSFGTVEEPNWQY